MVRFRGRLVSPRHIRGRDLPQGVPGWQATRVALCGVWPCRDVIMDEWYKTVLFTVSAVTTLLFLPEAGFGNS